VEDGEHRGAFGALLWTPDPKNGNAPPQRVQPAVSSQGISEGLDRAVNDMKGVIGIYDAGLGNKSNETSGKAILARQREGDVGTQSISITGRARSAAPAQS
jgi:hypothetical protein